MIEISPNACKRASSRPGHDQEHSQTISRPLNSAKSPIQKIATVAAMQSTAIKPRAKMETSFTLILVLPLPVRLLPRFSRGRRASATVHRSVPSRVVIREQQGGDTRMKVRLCRVRQMLLPGARVLQYL